MPGQVQACVREESTQDIVLDRRRSVEYAQKRQNTGLFSNVTTVWPLGP